MLGVSVFCELSWACCEVRAGTNLVVATQVVGSHTVLLDTRAILAAGWQCARAVQAWLGVRLGAAW